MLRYKVYYKPDSMEEICRRSPFNLKQDLKNIGDHEILRIAKDIAEEIHYGINRPPSIVPVYWDPLRRAAYLKIRIIDPVRDSGKSKGYRGIILLDCVNSAAFLLHIYRHSHGEKDNISEKAQNKLKMLVDEYAASLDLCL